MGPVIGGEPIDPAVFNVDWEKYYRALGRFMHEFARCENELNSEIISMVNHRILRLPVDGQSVIHALLGGSRLAGARDTLKRLLRVTNASKETKAEVDRLFAHLSDIHYMRDRIAHNGVESSVARAGWFVTTNQISVREAERIDWIAFTPAMLLAMADDLKRISYALSLAIDPAGKERVKNLAKTSKAWSRSLKYAAGPWRYKPSQLVKTGPKHERAPQSRAPQSRSSRA